MKKILLLALVVILAIFGFRYFKANNGAAKQYKAFAEEVLFRRYDRAAAMTLGMSPDEVARQGSQERIGGGPPMFQTIFPSRIRIESQETDGEGVVTIHGVQTVLFNPVGTESTRPAMFALLKQVVTLRKDAGEWKVTAFENTFDKMDTLSGH
jgi:hypothetical protein